MRPFSLCLGLIALLLLAHRAEADQILEQHFPSDGPPAKWETKWKIIWGVERHRGHSEVLYIKEAWFHRDRRDEKGIQVLGDSRLAEIFVPYVNGTRIYDITNYNFGLCKIPRQALGPVCLGAPALYLRDGKVVETGGFVAKEIHDAGNRWWTPGLTFADGSERSRRGQELHLWSILNAANYRYIMLYVFGDDGTISFRLGATGYNLYAGRTDANTHLHVGCWRINVVLDNQNAVEAKTVRFVSTEKGMRSVIKPFNDNVEGGIKWNPEEFMRLRLESTAVLNKHDPAHPVGYDLVPHVQGTGRLFGRDEKFTQHDLWVTPVDPMDKETNYRDLPKYVSQKRAINDGKGVVVWASAGLIHSTRDEDLGSEGDDPRGGGVRGGVATTSWVSFDLKPRNLFRRTPLFPGGVPEPAEAQPINPVDESR